MAELELRFLNGRWESISAYYSVGDEEKCEAINDFVREYENLRTELPKYMKERGITDFGAKILIILEAPGTETYSD